MSITSMKNGWTGGQYSLFRAVFGIFLLVHFAQFTPWAAELFSNKGVLPRAAESPVIHLFPNILGVWDSPLLVTALVIIAAVLCIFFAIGAFDRIAAIGLWYIWACLYGRDPLISNPSIPYVGLLLLAHACLRPAPYGSLAARGRADPSGGWKMDESVYTVVWVLMALGYTYSGYTKLVSPSWLNGNAFALVLNNPLARPGAIRNALLALPAPAMHIITWGVLAAELSFAPLSLSRKLRPWAWSVMLLMHLGLTTVISFADLSLGMVMLHLFTFNPSWIPPLKSSATETIFYDGHCGLCHRAVRFVLSENAGQMAFRFAPLDSDAFRAAADEETRRTLPDSLVVQTSDGRLLIRSSAVLQILLRLGGVWKVAARLAGLIPSKILDFVYDLVAGIRHRLFPAPGDACPLIPQELRARFES